MRSFILSALGGLLALSTGGCATPGPDDTGDTGDPAPLPLEVVPVNADIVVDTAWTATHLYWVQGDLAVTAALSIEPGTIVKLDPGLGLTVADGGAITVSGGDDEHRCVFTSVHDDAAGGDTDGDGAASTPAPGDWGSVVVRSSGSVFDHCTFQYGGAAMPYAGALVVSDDAVVTVTHSHFAYNQGGTPEDTRAAAFNAAGAGVGTVVTDNLFFANGLPLVIGGTFDVDDSNAFHLDTDAGPLGNLYSGVFWGGGYALSGDITWSATDAPFVVVANPVGIPEGASLTLPAGVTVKFGPGLRMDVDGGLAVTDARFTSLADDSDGHDSNGDGELSAPAPGDWASLVLNSSDVSLHGAAVHYGGSSAPYSGAVLVKAAAEPTLTDNTFAHNAGGSFDDTRAAALSLAGAGPGVVLTGNRFYANDLPLVINGGVSLDDSNQFAPPGDEPANVLDAIAMDGSSHTVEGATTWAETEVPVVIHGTVLTVESTGTLTLGLDVLIKADAARIDVAGVVEQAEGVAFTSLRDDSRGGDTNGDGGASSPAKGDWSGVNLCTGGPCSWATWTNIHYASYP